MSITPDEHDLAVRLRDEATAMGDHQSAADISTWLAEHPVDEGSDL
jgi:hypothetical protein